MKYYPRLNQFKASNVYFDVDKCRAYSYDWWCFVDKIGDYVVFNDYKYSHTTARHQSNVRWLLDKLGINVDYTIASPNGLQDLNSALTHENRAIQSLEDKINTPRTHKKTKENCLQSIEYCKKHIEVIRKLISIRNKQK